MISTREGYLIPEHRVVRAYDSGRIEFDAGNGQTLEGTAVDDPYMLCPQIVPAQPGYYVLFAVDELDGRTTAGRIPVVAWRVVGPAAFPVVPDPEATGFGDDAPLLMPTGEVWTAGTTFDSELAWLQHILARRVAPPPPMATGTQEGAA